MGTKFKSPRLGIMASGTGTNFKAILVAIERGDLPATAAVLITNNPQAGALTIAKAHNVPTAIVTDPDETRDQTITKILKDHQVDVVVLAGWLKLITAPLLDAYRDRIINIHPGPLPRFGGKRMYGKYVQEAVIKAGIKDSGPTVHLVDEQFDHGKILAHVSVPVKPDDTPETLAARVLPVEHDTYWRVIKSHFCQQNGLR